jgi:hypothetical protein
MKIWLRLHGFEPCSWTAVYEYLGAAFKEIGVELCDMVAPDEPEDYIELGATRSSGGGLICPLKPGYL